MAVATGGSLVEELGDSHVVLPPGTHPIDTVPGSVVAGLVPEGRVGSLHHQAVATYDDRAGAAPPPHPTAWSRRWSGPTGPRGRRSACSGTPSSTTTGPAVFGWLVARRPPVTRAAGPGDAVCPALYSPLTYRQTGTATSPRPRSGRRRSPRRGRPSRGLVEPPCRGVAGHHGQPDLVVAPRRTWCSASASSRPADAAAAGGGGDHELLQLVGLDDRRRRAARHRRRTVTWSSSSGGAPRSRPGRAPRSGRRARGRGGRRARRPARRPRRRGVVRLRRAEGDHDKVISRPTPTAGPGRARDG